MTTQEPAQIPPPTDTTAHSQDEQPNENIEYDHITTYDDARTACTACEKKMPLEPSPMRLDCNILLGDGDGPLPQGPFRVCSRKCQNFFAGAKKNRPKQQLVLRRMRASILETEIEVGGTVEVISDMSIPGRFVEAGRGTVLARRYVFERRSAVLSVRMHNGSVQKVWPAGLRTLDVENDVPPPRRCREAISPGKRSLLASLDAKNTLVGAVVVAADSQKRRAVGAEAAAVVAKRECDAERRISDDLRRCVLRATASEARLREELQLSNKLRESAERDAKTARRQRDRALETADDKAEKVAHKRYVDKTGADRGDAFAFEKTARHWKQAASAATAVADEAKRRADDAVRQNDALVMQVAAMRAAATWRTGPTQCPGKQFLAHL
jgi:hypothetical protein